VAGCLAVRITIGNNNDNASNKGNNSKSQYRYYAVADTGSPFLTAPPAAVPYTTSTALPDSTEQYGEAVGRMTWRRASVRLDDGARASAAREATTNRVDDARSTRCIVGIPQQNVVNETGGVFFGLMGDDDGRPTVLQQLGYASFVLDYGARLLTLSNQSLLLFPRPHSKENDNESIATMAMYDLSPYGLNLHHYAVKCTGLVLDTTNGPVHVSVLHPKMKRDVVVVFDTGLTGCIFSDSFLDDPHLLPIPIQTIRGATVMVAATAATGAAAAAATTTPPPINQQQQQLRSQAPYWNLACFRLPWFRRENDADHPHIVVAGATFLHGSKLTVDTESKRMRLEIPLPHLVQYWIVLLRCAVIWVLGLKLLNICHRQLRLASKL
jgi:hypothetical protein